MQDTRLVYENQLYFYTPTLHNQKLKLKNNAIGMSKIIKILGVNLTKDVKDLYSKKKKLLRETNEDLKGICIIQCS